MAKRYSKGLEILRDSWQRGIEILRKDIEYLKLTKDLAQNLAQW